VILAYSDHDNDVTQADAGDEEPPPDDVDNRVELVAGGAASRPGPPGRVCSTSLEQSLNELQLMRIELRGRDADAGGDRRRRLLYLGDVHTDRTQRPFYRPQSYQLPLVVDDPTHVSRRRRLPCQYYY